MMLSTVILILKTKETAVYKNGTTSSCHHIVLFCTSKCWLIVPFCGVLRNGVSVRTVCYGPLRCVLAQGRCVVS